MGGGIFLGRDGGRGGGGEGEGECGENMGTKHRVQCSNAYLE